MSDNVPEDEFHYELHVHTGFTRHAGTRSNVFFRLYGTKSETGARRVRDDVRDYVGYLASFNYDKHILNWKEYRFLERSKIMLFLKIAIFLSHLYTCLFINFVFITSHNIVYLAYVFKILVCVIKPGKKLIVMCHRGIK